jgi:two-component system, NarL family, response regulator DesR
MKEILVVEDHPLVAEATAQLLEQRFADIAVVTVKTAADAVKLIEESPQRWFRILLDLALPGAFGLSLAKLIAARGFAPICCVLSASDREDQVQQIRAWGFLGYLAKSMPVQTLTARLDDVMQGIGVFPSTLPMPRAPGIRLTARQIDTLEGVQRGLSSKQIAAQLHLAEGTVNNQVAVLMQLLQAESRSHAVAKAISLGLQRVRPKDTRQREKTRLQPTSWHKPRN